MPAPSGEPGEDYFNDLSQQPSHQAGDGAGVNEIPKPKRIACVLCRKRKLRCDGEKPSCATCTRLKHDCSYDEVRKKSGPKRGYVKALEARLAQVETLLKTQDEVSTNWKDDSNRSTPGLNGASRARPELGDIGTATIVPPRVGQHCARAAVAGNPTQPAEEPFPWEMIGLGLEEPLPTQDVVDELNQAYFDKVHLSMPMIHRPRYYAAMNLAPHMRPPVCLRYAMWANAAAVTDKYEGLQEHFYQRARKYIQQDEMRGHGESMITVAHCQTWVLLATYEFKLMYFPRAWMSAGRASRMAQMMGLHRLDGAGLEVKQCIMPPRDWTEREERRRTFWMSFSVDRYSSIGTGWPMSIEEKDIATSLPSDEESYELNRPSKTMTLSEALEPSGTPNLSPFAAVVLLACLFGRNLTHLHRPSPDDRDDDLNGLFWQRHRTIDNILLNTALSLPDLLRLPSGLNNPNIVFMNMNIHTSTICLHQAAIFKADKNRLPGRVATESKIRCITAAAEIASIMRQVSHLDLSIMNPFISFCLYVAARVFVQYLKSRPKDGQVRASLQFLLSAMKAIKRKNPLTESFLVQLDVDLEGAGLEDIKRLRSQTPQSSNAPTKSPGCGQPLVGQQNMDTRTYGNQGLAMYTQPNQPTNGQANRHQADSTASNTVYSFTPDISQFELPNRQRTPGSIKSSAVYQNPNNGYNPEMDTSPDGSGDQEQTPGSSAQSQHNPSSHTSHSPPNQQQEHQHINGLQMDPSAAVAAMMGSGLSADFPMSMVSPNDLNAHQQNAFPLSHAWGVSAGGSGLTPGLNMGAAGFNDMMNTLSDVDWNQMMESFDANSWESLGHAPQETMGRTS